MDAVRAITQAYETWGIRAIGLFPAGTFQVAINDKLINIAKACELGIAVFCYLSVPNCG